MESKLLFILLISLLLQGCLRQQPVRCQELQAAEHSAAVTEDDKIDGLTLVAPPRPFVSNPMVDIHAVNADWVAVIPYGFTRLSKPKVSYNLDWQWWGEREEGIVESIRLAKAKGIKVMLKPQIYIPNGWTGTLDFETVTAWESWEKTNTAYVLHMAELAEAEGVELFCLGTEFKVAIQKRPEYWVDLIRQVRAVYRGALTYASNWDNYQNIPFWSEMDYVGINAYFPLCDTKTPTTSELLKKWQPIVQEIEDFQCEINKPIVFTEFGYLSVDACASKTWELEQKVGSININEQAQAVALDALFLTFWDKSWWSGGFLWKWFPEMQGHEGYPEKDYTPQGKEAEKVISKWYAN